MNTAVKNRIAAFRVALASAAIVLLANGNQVVAQLRPDRAEANYQGELPPPSDPFPGDDELMLDAPAQLGVTFDRQVPDAAVVRSLAPRGAADNAGLQPGDTIEAINGNRVDSPRDAIEIVERMRPGDIVDVDFSRRITGRTQAVLDAQRQDRPITAYRERDTRSRERADQASYEELPPQRNSQNDARRTEPRPVAEPRDNESYDDRDDRREEPEQRGRFFDRRGRGRAFFPWRRN